MTKLFTVLRKCMLALVGVAALALPVGLTATPAAADSFAFSYSSGPGWHRGFHHGPFWGPSFSYAYIAPPVYYVPPPPPVYYVPPPPVVYAPGAYYGAPPVAAAPASPVYQAANGQYCREYRTTVVVGGQPQPSYGTACLQPDGVWRVVH